MPREPLLSRPVTDVDALVERSGALKREVLAFARHPRQERHLRQELRRRFGEEIVADEGELTDFLDWFIQQWRRPDGRTIVDLFLEARPDLPAAERTLLLGWHDVVEGIFEVVGRDDIAITAVNLVDELTYRIRSNVGPAILEHFPVGGFLISRVVPCHDEWIISGPARPAPAGKSENMLRAAAQLAMSRPDLSFRNPERLARAWEMQRADRDHFVACFGADLVILPIDRLPALATGVDDGTAPRLAAMLGLLVDDLELDPATATVGLIFDEYDGLGIYGDLGLVQEAFDDPELARRPRYRRVLKRYLTDDDLAPTPLVRMAERDEGRTDQVFRAVTGRPGFRWVRDGEALLRKHKPWAYDGPPLPRTVVVGDRLAPYVGGG